MTTQADADIWGSRDRTDEVLSEVRAERARQDAKWGEQNHRDSYGVEDLRASIRFTIGHESPARGAQILNEGAVANGCPTWSLILLEEVLEALVERDAKKLRAELVQVAAVAVQWAEAIDRRTKRGTP